MYDLHGQRSQFSIRLIESEHYKSQCVRFGPMFMQITIFSSILAISFLFSSFTLYVYTPLLHIEAEEFISSHECLCRHNQIVRQRSSLFGTYWM